MYNLEQFNRDIKISWRLNLNIVENEHTIKRGGWKTFGRGIIIIHINISFKQKFYLIIIIFWINSCINFQNRSKIRIIVKLKRNIIICWGLCIFKKRRLQSLAHGSLLCSQGRSFCSNRSATYINNRRRKHRPIYKWRGFGWYTNF